MLSTITWHRANKELAPLYTDLLLITDTEKLCVGSYRKYDGKLIRMIYFCLNDDLLNKKSGNTVLWAVLPGKEEIKSLIEKDL